MEVMGLTYLTDSGYHARIAARTWEVSIMTLDEAIMHCEEVADRCFVTDCDETCESEHRQLAEWLKELKIFRERSRIPTALYNRVVSSEILRKHRMDYND